MYAHKVTVRLFTDSDNYTVVDVSKTGTFV